MKRYHRAIVAGACVLVVVFFAWEWYLSPQARIERFLGRVADAAEDKDAERLLAFLSPDYSDFYNLDIATVADTLEHGFRNVDRLNVTVENVRAEVQGEQAEAVIDLTVVAVRGEERYLIVGSPMDPERIELQLWREGSDWKILAVSQRHRDPSSRR